MSILSERCPTTKQKGREHEQIQKAIAYDLASRASHRMGAKYRYRVMDGKIKEEVESSVREQSRQMSCEVQEMNVQADRVHLIVQVPPKLSISEYMGRLEGKSAIRVFSMFRDLRRHRYWGKHFWAQGGYCVGTVGVGPRDDTEVGKMAGEAGTTSRGVPIQPRMNKPGQRAAPFGRGLFTNTTLNIWREVADIRYAIMKIAPTRQQLSSLAMVSILFGVAVTIVVGWIYWRFNGTLNEILSHDAQNDVRGFIKAFKALVFLMLPGFCACLLGLSLGVMLYLNEESGKAASSR